MAPGTCDARHKKKNYIANPSARSDDRQRHAGPQFLQEMRSRRLQPTGPSPSGPAQVLFKRPL